MASRFAPVLPIRCISLQTVGFSATHLPHLPFPAASHSSAQQFDRHFLCSRLTGLISIVVSTWLAKRHLPLFAAPLAAWQPCHRLAQRLRRWQRLAAARPAAQRQVTLSFLDSQFGLAGALPRSYRQNADGNVSILTVFGQPAYDKLAVPLSGAKPGKLAYALDYKAKLLPQ
ncbi:hypothetical protein OL229_10505 [Neisseriaceae bacterium JH1-16]|nr:hypothetical protein [Neisseriaceae bacterium JH1-16]